jgi:hypothetical protein
MPSKTSLQSPKTERELTSSKFFSLNSSPAVPLRQVFVKEPSVAGLRFTIVSMTGPPWRPARTFSNSAMNASTLWRTRSTPRARPTNTHLSVSAAILPGWIRMPVKSGTSRISGSSRLNRGEKEILTGYRPSGIAVAPGTFTWKMSPSRTTSSNVKHSKSESMLSSPIVAWGVKPLPVDSEFQVTVLPNETPRYLATAYGTSLKCPQAQSCCPIYRAT